MYAVRTPGDIDIDCDKIALANVLYVQYVYWPLTPVVAVDAGVILG